MSRYPCTMVLLGSVLIVFCVELAFGPVGNPERLLALGALPDSGEIKGEYWRLLTYAWLHSGYLHLAGNAVLLWFVGRIVERRTGGLTMLGIYVACALAGGSVILWNETINPHAGTTQGASAAVLGLLACALVLLNRPSEAAFGHAPWVRNLLLGTLVGTLVTSFLPGVSLAGHIGGLVPGFLFGFVVPVRAPREAACPRGGGPR